MKSNAIKLAAIVFPFALQFTTVHADPATQPTTKATSQPTTQAALITWSTAKKHIGETVTTTGPVMGTHVVSADKLILNVGKDYPDRGRLSVLIQGKVNEADYKDKTVTVTGKVEMFKGSPEIKVSPSDVTIQK